VKEQLFVGLHIGVTVTATSGGVEDAIHILHTAELNHGPKEQKVFVATFAELFQRRMGDGVRIARGGGVQITYWDTQQVLQFGSCR
jgi:hypothetical protein